MRTLADVPVALGAYVGRVWALGVVLCPLLALLLAAARGVEPYDNPLWVEPVYHSAWLAFWVGAGFAGRQVVRAAALHRFKAGP